jgi:hypothetical protein
MALSDENEAFIDMPDENIDAVAQSAVVVQLLQRPDGLPMATLAENIVELETERVVAAANSLSDVGVVRCHGDRVYATPALNRLDVIGMVVI